VVEVEGLGGIAGVHLAEFLVASLAEESREYPGDLTAAPPSLVCSSE
jgi:hypothetical protein